MSEQFLSASIREYCEHLLALRKSRDWSADWETFDDYVKARWSLSKTRAKRYCHFALFCRMAEAAKLPIPDSPDNIAPILSLAQKRWMHAWEIVYSEGPVNELRCKAVLAHYGFVLHKRIPENVKLRNDVKKATKTLAEIRDGEALVDKLGPNLGHDWDMAGHVWIEADQKRQELKRK